LDTRILIIGSEVIIPFSEEDDLLVTPTPYPLLVGDPICYPTTDGSLWCYALLSNDLEIPLEDISLAINLFEEDQLPVMSQIAFPPVDILFPGQRIPAGTLIQAPPADLIRISTTLLSAYGSSQQGPGVQITDYSLTYSQGDTIAQVTGFFEIDSEDSPEGQVWIVGVALNEGKPVGVRKWVSAEGLEAGTGYPFELTLYSLGPEIDQVDLISELH
jgi:hypothetical protein